MQFLIGAFGSVIASTLGRFVLRLIANLGIGLISYKGASVILGQLQTYVTTLVGGLSGDVANAFCAFGGNAALSIIFAAYAARAALAAISKIGFKTTKTA